MMRGSWIPNVPACVADLIIPEPNTGCWLWLGNSWRPQSRYEREYGRISVHGVYSTAHRAVYVLLRGATGMRRRDHVHHLCDVSLCVNPDHLVSISPGDHAREHRRRERAAQAQERAA